MKKVSELFGLMLKVLCNQRGDTGGADPNAVELDENGFIPGTNYTNVADLIKGHSEIKSKFDAQGNEIGALRKEHDGLKTQAQTLAETLQKTLEANKAPAPKGGNGADVETERAAITKQIAKLDPISDNYQAELADLLDKRDRLTATVVKDQVMSTAGNLFKEELTARDQKAAMQRFYDDNPDFNTPEVQAIIKDYMAKDKTGLHDPMSAYFKFKADSASSAAAELSAKNEELMKVLNVQDGANKTGKVILKGQAPPAAPTKPERKSGKDLEAGAFEALSKVG